MSQLQIRRLVRSDAADYRMIRLAALQQEPQAFGSTYEAEADRPLSAFAERLEGSVVLGAYADGRIVGMAGFKQREGARERHKAFVWGTYVEPGMRRRGVAAALMTAVLEAAAEVVEQLTLCVVEDNAQAIALYRKLGFSIYGVEPQALRSGSGYVDEVLMMRRL
jgi:ribosomal protein S18 acetylase RimI-like enzyme